MYTLHNKGLREIHFNGGILKPNSYLKVEQSEGDKLYNLFPDEITIIEKVAEVAKAEATKVLEKQDTQIKERGIKDFNKTQLLEVASKLGLIVPDEATKKDIIDLIQESQKKPTPDEDNNAPQ